ncbi:MAG: threonylcarbamoyl-AMP synthase [Deltaproteobacteria bacterium]|nr:threonylcarbamoyl-AMP synthase [Deltaproteobacteria bacterium]
MRRARVIAIDPTSPDPAAVREVAACLRAGGLVALPTETVYGLAAHALDAQAVARIFAAKGRPATNPLIVHVADAAAAARLAASWPETAALLARRFWPGPLTLVVPRAPMVPDVVTAGGSTVALRVPGHPVALAVLREAGLPLAAPSANLSSAISPTTAQHVLAGLGDRLDRETDLVIDAGPSPGGIESTVIHLGVDPPRLLRPGLVTPAEIEAVIGPVARGAPIEGPAPSPGMMERHYAPRARLEVRTDAAARAKELSDGGARVGWIGFDAPPSSEVLAVILPRDAAAYAARLYGALHHLDDAGVDHVVVAAPPDSDEWLAVRDRLQRASAAPG